MQSSQIIMPIIHPKRRPRTTQSWKHRSKRPFQSKHIVSITLYPGYAVMDDESAYIIPFDEVIA